MKDKEQHILEKVKDGDKSAFQKLFYNYHESLFRFVAYRMKDTDLADDITQETFLRVWKTRESLKPKKSFFSLISRISSNLCNDHFRHLEVRQRHQESVSDYVSSESPDPEMINQGQALKEEIQRIVTEKLPERCRNIFILSRIDKKSNPEISEILNLSIRTVENQIYRAIKILKKNLINYL
ncbi:MAG: hypothetical protein CMG74_08765 [Candidatus Marinimicrobia bacterium]|nr:hypothetical protein [Candidatus Neomarinimicrobiota bacterium]|tara:strand:- start:58257 stop:58802 length:546 start_codon:yes stop_codon:yes gene_type:complete